MGSRVCEIAKGIPDHRVSRRIPFAAPLQILRIYAHNQILNFIDRPTRFQFPLYLERNGKNASMCDGCRVNNCRDISREIGSDICEKSYDAKLNVSFSCPVDIVYRVG